MVLVLNALKFPFAKVKTLMPGAGTPLNKRQWEVISKLTPQVDAWNSVPEVGASEMGRAAVKVESIESLLRELEAKVQAVDVGLRHYGKQSKRKPAPALDPEEERSLKKAAGVVGTMPHPQMPVAKEVEPDRYQFCGVPSFDPADFLDDHNRETFLFPLEWAEEPDSEQHRVPRVRVYASTKNKRRLLEVLDGCDRLQLLPAHRVRMDFRNGMFSIPKDAKKDRMVLDARPPNMLEDGKDSDWISSLGSVSQLNHWFLKDEDIKDYYHAFHISEQRACRNALAMEVTPEEVSHLRSFKPWMRRHRTLVPCLATMAMGDCRAVTSGQVSHLACLLRASPMLDLDSFITLRGRPGRGDLLAGLMIDDFVMIEKRLRGSDASCDSAAEKIIADVRKKYAEVNLPRHPDKAVEGETCASFWGVDFDGAAGEIHPARRRSVPLAFIIVEVLKIGYVTKSLLEVLAGSLVSVFAMRRRLMSLLEQVYIYQRNLEDGDIVAVTYELATELLQCLALIPLSFIDLRLKPSATVVASDASPWSTAAAKTTVSKSAMEELQRHALQKGAWNRLLNSAGAYLREQGLLPEERELPEGAAFDMHPLWEEIVSSKTFEKFGRVMQRPRRQRINIGEVKAALDAELLQGREEPNSYYIHLQDSQVSLACMVKGRSSSTEINSLLKGSIPDHIVNNNRAFYGYVRSKKNPADAPTREREIEPPERQAALWLEGAEQGDFAAMDSFLQEHGVDVAAIRGLPPADQLLPRLEPDLRPRRVRRSRVAKESPVKGGRVPSKRTAEGETSVTARDGGAGVPGVLSGDGGGVAAASKTTGGEQETVQKDLDFEVERLVPPEEGHVRSVSSDLPSDFPRSPPGLSEELRALLRVFPVDQFVFSPSFDSLEAAFDSGPGILDLFSGSRGFSRACVRNAPCWTLTFDLAHSPSEDLLSPSLQGSLVHLLESGAFRAMGAGPVCASFSEAITPPCRTLQYPEGVPWTSELQKQKNLLGNKMLLFVQRLCRVCLAKDVFFWVENPHGSWMWRQVGAMSWDDIMASCKVGDAVLDYCRFHTPWRKRTRFRTSLHIKNQRCLCLKNHVHVALRGHCKSKGVLYTKLAEPYPRGVCEILAWATLADTGLLPERRKLDLVACAREAHARFGEAANPGPRSRAWARSNVWLADVELLEPATVKLRGRVWKEFTEWLAANFEGALFEQWLKVSPLLVVSAFVAYGNYLFGAGGSLNDLRQLLAHSQKTFPQLRPYMTQAWDTVTRWEVQEPIQHRPPLPEPILAAMVALALSWKWPRWSAVTLACFYSVSRIGELLKVKRKHVLTPRDLLQTELVLYIRFEAPKTRRRGARIQYSTVKEPDVVRFLCAIWDSLSPNELLYPGSQSSYRGRWDAILRKLEIEKRHQLTPGGLRGGGAVALHRRGLALVDLMWAMRLQHSQTLAFYLQETSAVSLLPALPEPVRHRIQTFQLLYPHLLKEARSATPAPRA